MLHWSVHQHRPTDYAKIFFFTYIGHHQYHNDDDGEYDDHDDHRDHCGGNGDCHDKGVENMPTAIIMIIVGIFCCPFTREVLGTNNPQVCMTIITEMMMLMVMMMK